MTKLCFRLSVSLLLIFLTGCSVGNSQNQQGKYDTALSQESVTLAGQNEEQTSERTVQERAEELLNKESYELIWNVEEKEFPDTVDSWNISSVDMDALWVRMKTDLFPDGQIQSDERKSESGVRIIQVKSGEETIVAKIGSKSIAINGMDREKNPDFYKKLAEFLSKETGMDCVEGIILADTDVQIGYSFQIDDIPIDQDGYPRGSEWVEGFFYGIDEDGGVTVEGIVKKESVSGQLDLKSVMSIDELKILCQAQWVSSGFPFVCVLEDLRLVYMKSEDSSELIPAYYLGGQFYQKNVDGTITSKDNSFLINAVTGEIVRFV